MVADEFVGKLFGPSNQLEVIGWDGSRIGGNKLYTVKCSICSLDPEMYGNAEYKYTKGHILGGRIPCGCSKSPKLSESQMLLRVKREADRRGFEFKGVHGDFLKAKTRLILSCKTHGEMEPKTYNDFMSGRGCIECRRDNVSRALKLEDDVLVDRFMQTGSFPDGTIFSRSDKRVPSPRYREGYGSFWEVYCPTCKETTVNYVSSLTDGSKSCSCSAENKRFAYIHTISENENVIAIKYGVSTSPAKRLRGQRRLCIFKMDSEGVWEFQKASLCRRAELEVKRTVPSGVISKDSMLDGWSETCTENYRDVIVEIYEKHGGTRRW